MKNGCELISKERKRQIEKEGWTHEYDEVHCDLTLAVAAATYILDCAAIHSGYNASWRKMYRNHSDDIWPFDQ